MLLFGLRDTRGRIFTLSSRRSALPGNPQTQGKAMTSSNSPSGIGADGRADDPVYRPKGRKKAPATPVLLRILRLVFRSGGLIAPALTGRLACRLWYQTTRFPLPALEKNALLDADVKRQEINGSTVASYAWGDTGAWVLLIHGWNGRGTQLSAFVKPLLHSGFRVLAFDAPAHGKSSGKRKSKPAK